MIVGETVNSRHKGIGQFVAKGNIAVAFPLTVKTL
jgi:hypothetical protein